MSVELENISQQLNELSRVIKLDFDIALQNNPNLGPQHKKSALVNLIEANIQKMENALQSKKGFSKFQAYLPIKKIDK